MELPQLTVANPLGAIAQAQQVQAGQQEMALRNQQMQGQSLALEQQQRQQESQQTLMDAYQKAGGDPDKALALAKQSGRVLPQDIMNAQKGLLEMKNQTLDYVQKVGAKAISDSALMNGAHDQVTQAPPEQRPAVYQQQLQALGQAGVDVSKMPPQYPGDEQFSQMALPLKTHDQLVKEAADQLGMKKTVAETAKDAAQGLEADANTKLAQSKANFYAQNGIAPGVSPEEQGLVAYLKKNPGKTADDFLAWKAKLAPTANFNLQMAAGGGLQSGALDQAAQRYLQTGQLPPGGRGAAGLAQNRAIMNRAAELGAGQDITANKTFLKANADSLNAMQKNFDNVTAFENTAGKNLDQFLSTAKKVVDTGSPFLNTPLRQINSKMVGDENMAAFNAARQTALTEIAKVLSSANAGSGVVSDSARGEVEQLIGPNASLKQIYSAAAILKQDMANRHTSYQEQIADIKKRIYPVGGGSQNANTSTANDGGMTITLPSGKTVTIK